MPKIVTVGDSIRMINGCMSIYSRKRLPSDKWYWNVEIEYRTDVVIVEVDDEFISLDL